MPISTHDFKHGIEEHTTTSLSIQHDNSSPYRVDTLLVRYEVANPTLPINIIDTLILTHGVPLTHRVPLLKGRLTVRNQLRDTLYSHINLVHNINPTGAINIVQLDVFRVQNGGTGTELIGCRADPLGDGNCLASFPFNNDSIDEISGIEWLQTYRNGTRNSKSVYLTSSRVRGRFVRLNYQSRLSFNPLNRCDEWSMVMELGYSGRVYFSTGFVLPSPKVVDSRLGAFDYVLGHNEPYTPKPNLPTGTFRMGTPSGTSYEYGSSHYRTAKLTPVLLTMSKDGVLTFESEFGIGSREFSSPLRLRNIGGEVNNLFMFKSILSFEEAKGLFTPKTRCNGLDIVHLAKRKPFVLQGDWRHLIITHDCQDSVIRRRVENYRNLIDPFGDGSLKHRWTHDGFGVDVVANARGFNINSGRYNTVSIVMMGQYREYLAWSSPHYRKMNYRTLSNVDRGGRYTIDGEERSSAGKVHTIRFDGKGSLLKIRPDGLLYGKSNLHEDMPRRIYFINRSSTSMLNESDDIYVFDRVITPDEAKQLSRGAFEITGNIHKGEGTFPRSTIEILRIKHTIQVGYHNSQHVQGVMDSDIFKDLSCVHHYPLVDDGVDHMGDKDLIVEINGGKHQSRFGEVLHNSRFLEVDTNWLLSREPVTYSFWVKFDGGEFAITDSETRGFRFRVIGENTILEVTDRDSTSNPFRMKAYTLATTPNEYWHTDRFVVISIDKDSTCRTYLDGALQANSVFNLNSIIEWFNRKTSGYTYIPNLAFGGFRNYLPLSGSLYNFREFNRGLTQLEVTTLANEGRGILLVTSPSQATKEVFLVTSNVPRDYYTPSLVGIHDIFGDNSTIQYINHPKPTDEFLDVRREYSASRYAHHSPVTGLGFGVPHDMREYAISWSVFRRVKLRSTGTHSQLGITMQYKKGDIRSNYFTLSWQRLASRFSGTKFRSFISTDGRRDAYGYMIFSGVEPFEGVAWNFTSSDIPTGKWHTITMSQSYANEVYTCSMWVDGVKDTVTSPTPMFPTTEDTRGLNVDIHRLHYAFAGTGTPIAQFRMFNRSVSDAEVEKLVERIPTRLDLSHSINDYTFQVFNIRNQSAVNFIKLESTKIADIFGDGGNHYLWRFEGHLVEENRKGRRLATADDEPAEYGEGVFGQGLKNTNLTLALDTPVVGAWTLSFHYTHSENPRVYRFGVFLGAESSGGFRWASEYKGVFVGGETYHVAVTSDNDSNVITYINGAIHAGLGFHGSHSLPSFNTIIIDGSERLDGWATQVRFTIDQLRVINMVLSQEEVIRLGSEIALPPSMDIRQSIQPPTLAEYAIMHGVGVHNISKFNITQDITKPTQFYRFKILHKAKSVRNTIFIERVKT